MEKISFDDIFIILKDLLIDNYDIRPENILLDANLSDDLELEQSDIIEIINEMQKFTTNKISVEDMKKIKTINDIIKTVKKLLEE